MTPTDYHNIYRSTPTVQKHYRDLSGTLQLQLVVVLSDGS